MLYELVVVVDPKLDEKKAWEKLTHTLESEGFHVSATKHLGERELAYPIDKKDKGRYFSFVLRATEKNPNTINTKFRHDETILRSLVLRKEEGKKSV